VIKKPRLYADVVATDLDYANMDLSHKDTHYFCGFDELLSFCREIDNAEHNAT
jgi:hypothetical protein